MMLAILLLKVETVSHLFLYLPHLAYYLVHIKYKKKSEELNWTKLMYPNVLQYLPQEVKKNTLNMMPVLYKCIKLLFVVFLFSARLWLP